MRDVFAGHKEPAAQSHQPLFIREEPHQPMFIHDELRARPNATEIADRRQSMRAEDLSSTRRR